MYDYDFISLVSNGILNIGEASLQNPQNVMI